LEASGAEAPFWWSRPKKSLQRNACFLARLISQAQATKHAGANLSKQQVPHPPKCGGLRNDNFLASGLLVAKIRREKVNAVASVAAAPQD
jgi:hypothetical protein